MIPRGSCFVWRGNIWEFIGRRQLTSIEPTHAVQDKNNGIVEITPRVERTDPLLVEENAPVSVADGENNSKNNGSSSRSSSKHREQKGLSTETDTGVRNCVTQASTVVVPPEIDALTGSQALGDTTVCGISPEREVPGVDEARERKKSCEDAIGASGEETSSAAVDQEGVADTAGATAEEEEEEEEAMTAPAVLPRGEATGSACNETAANDDRQTTAVDQAATAAPCESDSAVAVPPAAKESSLSSSSSPSSSSCTTPTSGVNSMTNAPGRVSIFAGIASKDCGGSGGASEQAQSTTGPAPLKVTWRGQGALDVSASMVVTLRGCVSSFLDQHISERRRQRKESAVTVTINDDETGARRDRHVAVDGRPINRRETGLLDGARVLGGSSAAAGGERLSSSSSSSSSSCFSADEGSIAMLLAEPGSRGKHATRYNVEGPGGLETKRSEDDEQPRLVFVGDHLRNGERGGSRSRDGAVVRIPVTKRRINERGPSGVAEERHDGAIDPPPSSPGAAKDERPRLSQSGRRQQQQNQQNQNRHGKRSRGSIAEEAIPVPPSEAPDWSTEKALDNTRHGTHGHCHTTIRSTTTAIRPACFLHEPYLGPPVAACPRAWPRGTTIVADPTAGCKTRRDRRPSRGTQSRGKGSRRSDKVDSSRGERTGQERHAGRSSSRKGGLGNASSCSGGGRGDGSSSSSGGGSSCSHGGSSNEGEVKRAGRAVDETKGDSWASGDERRRRFGDGGSQIRRGGHGFRSRRDPAVAEGKHGRS